MFSLSGLNKLLIVGIFTMASSAMAQNSIAFSPNTVSLVAGNPVNIVPQSSGFAVGQSLGCALAQGPLPPGLTLNATTCSIQGTIPLGTLPPTGQVFSLTFSAPTVATPISLQLATSDQYAIQFSQQTYLLVAGQAVNIVPMESGFGIGESLGCALSQGALPPGLALSATTCAIQGTIPLGVLPVNGQVFSVTLASPQLLAPITLQLAANDQYSIQFSQSNYSILAGQSVNLVPSSSGFAPGESLGCALSQGTLPPGLTLTPATCAIQGSIPLGTLPPAGQVFSVSLRSPQLLAPITLQLLASDNYAIQFPQTTNRVAAGQVINLVPTSNGFAVGESLGCALSQGTLPPGLTLNPTTCAIQGTVALGTLPAGDQIFNVTLASPQILAPIPLQFICNDPYTIQFSQSTYQFLGGQVINITPVANGFAIGQSLGCTVLQGTLPPGLALNPTTCAIQGMVAPSAIPSGGLVSSFSLTSPKLQAPIALQIILTN